MKKIITFLMMFMILFPLVSCNKEIPDYTEDEAFDLMNEAISNYLDADSLSITYEGSYTAPNYTNSESMVVKMKNIGSSKLIGLVAINGSENDTSFYSEMQFQSGVLYTFTSRDNSSKYVKEDYEADDYVTLYQSFLKAEIAKDKTRNIVFQADEDYLTVQFELGSSVVSKTFYVSSIVKTVSYATISIKLTHKAKLVSADVVYDGNMSEVQGTQVYHLEFKKINSYLVIAQLSSSERSRYTEESTDE